MDIQKRLDETDKRSSTMIMNALESHMSQPTKESLSKFSLALKAIVYNHGQACKRASLEYLARSRNK